MLTHKQATALAGELYAAWANGDGREHARSMVAVPAQDPVPGEPVREWKWAPDDEYRLDGEPAAWEAAQAFLTKVAEREARYSDKDALHGKKRPLEETFGPLVDRLLSCKGILKIDPASRESVLNSFHSALRDAFAARARKADGDYSADPKATRFPEFEPPQSASVPPSPRLSSKLTLSDLLERWWAESKAANRAQKTYDSYERTFRQLGDFLKRDNAEAVTGDDIRRFKEHRLANGASLKTVKDSDLAALKSIFGWALANGLVASNPTERVKFAAPKKIRTRGPEFTTEEASALLRHARDYRPTKRVGARMAAAKRWVPWLCAYTGARVGEIVQLRRDDIRQVGQEWVLTITPEAGTVKDKQAREVPLHDDLIKQGFIDYVESVPKARYIFLDAKSKDDMHGVWQAAKNRLAEFAREVVKDPHVQPNQGWRHTFKTIGHEAGIQDSVLDAICGHAPRTVGGSYGSVTLAAKTKALKLYPAFEL